jgi:hypothetical protein
MSVSSSTKTVDESDYIVGAPFVHSHSRDFDFDGLCGPAGSVLELDADSFSRLSPSRRENDPPDDLPEHPPLLRDRQLLEFSAHTDGRQKVEELERSIRVDVVLGQVGFSLRERKCRL